MNKFGKALKPINVDQLMADIQKVVKKPKKYRPKKMTEEEHIRRQKKARYEWYKRERDKHGYTVYYDRKRKGWFYKDVFGNRYGRYGSKDNGFSDRDKAINAIQRRHKKLVKQMNEAAKVENVALTEYGAYPDPAPFPELDEVIVQYDAYCNKCRRDCYGSKAPSNSLYVEFFGRFEEENPKVNIAGWTRAEMERKDGNFSITLMLSYQDLQPVYEEIDGLEVVTGLEDL